MVTHEKKQNSMLARSTVSFVVVCAGWVHEQAKCCDG
jgi:hypothetical protein